MPVPNALVCVRCRARYPVDHFAEDCPAFGPDEAIIGGLDDASAIAAALAAAQG
jgi:hypothetical protein